MDRTIPTKYLLGILFGINAAAVGVLLFVGKVGLWDAVLALSGGMAFAVVMLRNR